MRTLLLATLLLAAAACALAQNEENPEPEKNPTQDPPAATPTIPDWVNGLRKKFETILSSVTTVRHGSKNGGCSNYDDTGKNCWDLTNAAALAENAALVLSQTWNGDFQYAILIVDEDNEASLVATCDDPTAEGCSVEKGGSISSGADPIELTGASTAGMKFRYLLVWYNEASAEKYDPLSFKPKADDCASKSESVGDVTACFASDRNKLRGASCVLEGDNKQEGAFQLYTTVKGLPVPTYWANMKLGSAQKPMLCMSVATA